MLNWKVCVMLTSAAVMVSTRAQASDPAATRSIVLQKLLDCRTVGDSAQRLACFDAQASVFDRAETARDVIVIDRTQATKSRKENFGLPTSSLPVLGVRKDEVGEAVTDITTKIKGASQQKSGYWLFVLEDGARWLQTEGKTIRLPKPGQSIRIRKGALGGFLANVNGQTAIRVRRLESR